MSTFPFPTQQANSVLYLCWTRVCGGWCAEARGVTGTGLHPRGRSACQRTVSIFSICIGVHLRFTQAAL